MSFWRDMFDDAGAGAGDGPLDAPNTLGDVVASPSEAEAARSAVKLLDSIFAAAGSPAKYKPQVDEIDADWDRLNSLVFDIVGAVMPYSTLGVNAMAKAIGLRAQTLATTIANESSGAIAPPVANPVLNPSPASSLWDDLGTAGKAILGVGAVAVGLKLFDVLSTTPTVVSGAPPSARRRRRRKP